MPKNTRQEVTEAYLRSVPTPNHANTYTVISHGFIIDKIEEQLTLNGFTIEKVDYYSSMFGDVARGKVYIKSTKDPDMGMIFTWINSYNKMVKFSCAVGGFIYDNNASFIGSEGMSWIRRHTGTADEEAVNVIEQLISHAEQHFDSIIDEKNRMKNVQLSTQEYGCIMGALYFEHELITPNQATVVKKVYHDTIAKQDYTLWDLYKILMFGLDVMDLRKWQPCQQKLHHMIMTEYAIASQTVQPIITFTPTEVEDDDDTQESESLLAAADLESETFVETNEDSELLIDVAPERVKFAVDNSEEDEELGIDDETFDAEVEVLTTEQLVERYGDQVDLTEFDQDEDAILLPVAMSEEQIEMIEEEFGVVDKINTTVEGHIIEHPFDEEEFLDIPEHEGLVLPGSVIQQAAIIEKRMLELYGTIHPYYIEETEKQINVILDNTKESFYIKVTN